MLTGRYWRQIESRKMKHWLCQSMTANEWPESCRRTPLCGDIYEKCSRLMCHIHSTIIDLRFQNGLQIGEKRRIFLVQLIQKTKRGITKKKRRQKKPSTSKTATQRLLFIRFHSTFSSILPCWFLKFPLECLWNAKYSNNSSIMNT